MFRDGTLGDYTNSTIDILKTSSTAQSWNFEEGLKNVTVSTGTLTVKITSTREVFKDINGLEAV